MTVRSIAFYLPQFHPIPENDAWWGRGFTEWTNVTRARPLFRGHYQPRLPADLGFCDLRVPETRQAQAALARSHGLEAFCYWHYWFQGRRLLERPFQEVLQSGEPDFPFCLAWANEPWSRRWLGEERDVLQPQLHSAEDDVAHARWLAAAFADPRHVRVGERPLFLVYRPTFLPEPRRTTDVLREESSRLGLPEPYLVGIDAHCPGVDCRTLGFDSTLVFEPQLNTLPGAFEDRASPARLARNAMQGVPSASLRLYSERSARDLMRRAEQDFPTVPCVFVGWDNSPRRGRSGVILLTDGPQLFRDRVGAAAAALSDRPREERLLFVNAWNEWAEGNHLEPDQRFGRAYLEGLQQALRPRAAD